MSQLDTITYRQAQTINIYCAVEGCEHLATYRLELGMVKTELFYCGFHLWQLLDTTQSGWEFIDGDAATDSFAVSTFLGVTPSGKVVSPENARRTR